MAGDAVAIMHRPGRKRWNGGGAAAYWEHGSVRQDRVHPTQKPIALMADLVTLFSQPDDLVMDPFNGSGSTGVAALRLGRRYIGVELNDGHVETSRRRLADASGENYQSADGSTQMGLFDASA